MRKLATFATVAVIVGGATLASADTKYIPASICHPIEGSSFEVEDNGSITANDRVSCPLVNDTNDNTWGDTVVWWNGSSNGITCRAVASELYGGSNGVSYTFWSPTGTNAGPTGQWNTYWSSSKNTTGKPFYSLRCDVNSYRLNGIRWDE